MVASTNIVRIPTSTICTENMGNLASPKPGLSLKGGKFGLDESRGTKSESLFHASCYHNQMYELYAGKD